MPAGFVQAVEASIARAPRPAEAVPTSGVPTSYHAIPPARAVVAASKRQAAAIEERASFKESPHGIRGPTQESWPQRLGAPREVCQQILGNR